MYTLTINVHSECRELLDNLLITLETVSGEISEIESIDLLTVSGPVCINRDESPFGVTQRNLFLDHWSIHDGFNPCD